MGTGLIVANILRKKDNLVKLVGTSASIVTITTAQCLFVPELRQSTLTVQTVVGIGIIAISTWLYHLYKEQSLSSEVEYIALSRSTREDEDG
jgi:UDP-sugar transporter A1/2/3